MTKIVLILLAIFSGFFIVSAYANPDGTLIQGDLRILGTPGVSGLVFPDGSVQYFATAQGPAGPQGPSGNNGYNSLMNLVTEAAGANCSSGGVKLQVGLDQNRNSVLDEGEITQTKYVCNISSTSGLTGFWRFSITPAGSEQQVLGVSYLAQNGNNITGTPQCGTLPATGTINGNAITINWSENGNVFSISGLMSGESMSGSYDYGNGQSGTWLSNKIYSSTCGGSSPYYEIYGAQAGDYSLQRTGHQLIGTSNSGNVFNMNGYSRFIIYVPSTSSKILFDAIGLDSGWVYSQPGNEYMHRTTNMLLTGSSWDVTDSYIEGPPDGFTMENVPGTDAFYGFTTAGAQTLTVYIK